MIFIFAPSPAFYHSLTHSLQTPACKHQEKRAARQLYGDEVGRKTKKPRTFIPGGDSAELEEAKRSAIALKVRASSCLARRPKRRVLTIALDSVSVRTYSPGGHRQGHQHGGGTAPRSAARFHCHNRRGFEGHLETIGHLYIHIFIVLVVVCQRRYARGVNSSCGQRISVPIAPSKPIGAAAPSNESRLVDFLRTRSGDYCRCWCWWCWWCCLCIVTNKRHIIWALAKLTISQLNRREAKGELKASKDASQSGDFSSSFESKRERNIGRA